MDLSRPDRDHFRRATHALVSEYEAESYGHPDPEWTGAEPHGIQDLRWQSALLANMCMWVMMPSPVCVSCGFHALTSLGARRLERPVVNHIDKETTLFCHERDLNNTLSSSRLQKAAQLFEVISTVPRQNAVWPALRAFWAALVSYPADMRYPLFWQGLESLFGSDNEERGIGKRLRERISYFVAENETQRSLLNDQVKECYAQRSAIVHGRWEDSREFHDVHMYTTEAIVRTVLRYVVERPGMLAMFLSQRRNYFLQTWVQSQAFAPPPMP